MRIAIAGAGAVGRSIAGRYCRTKINSSCEVKAITET